MATLDAARHAKQVALVQLDGRADLAGIGIRARDGDYSITVSLRTPATVSLPNEIAGVSATYRYIGEIRLL